MRAGKLLSDIRRMKLQIDAEIESVARMRALAESETVRNDICSGEADWRSELVLRIVDAERKTSGRIGQLMSMREQFRQLLTGLPMEKHRMILTLRYIDALSWCEIAGRMRCGLGEVHGMHNAAIASLEEFREFCIASDASCKKRVVQREGS